MARHVGGDVDVFWRGETPLGGAAIWRERVPPPRAARVDGRAGSTRRPPPARRRRIIVRYTKNEK